MQCHKCHSEFSSNDHKYCPTCGTPVRSALPPLPPRRGINGCMLGCIISVALFFAIMICLPILTLWLSNIFMTPIIFENITQQDTEQIEEALQHTPTSSSHKYHMYGTISDNTDIYMALDEPSSGMLQGELYIQPSQQQNSVPHSVSGTITTDGDVTLTITDPSTNELQQWTGIAVTNPYGITAIKGTITQTSEKFYITRR